MDTVLTIIGYIITGVFVCLIMMGLIFCFQYVLWFHSRRCKHCNHSMDYKGLKEDKDEGHFLFHCNHCGAWEQVPKIEFFQDMEKSPMEK